MPRGEVDVLLGGAMMTVVWRPECRWLGCHVADGRCRAVANGPVGPAMAGPIIELVIFFFY